jgi:predicted nucleic acid-binding protein
MLDTNICIYAIKKNENALANIQPAGTRESAFR